MQRQSSNSLPSTPKTNQAVSITTIHAKRTISSNIPMIVRSALPRSQTQTRHIRYDSLTTDNVNLSSHSQTFPQLLSFDNKRGGGSSRPEEHDEIIRPRVEPRCSCLREHVIVDVDAQKVLWVHEAYCRLMQQEYNVCVSLATEEDEEEEEVQNESESQIETTMMTMTESKSASQATDVPFRANICLRVEALPQALMFSNLRRMEQFFLQFPGFRGVRGNPDNEGYLFVGFETDEQAHKAREALDGLLVTLVNQIRISIVEIQQAENELNGTKRFNFKDIFSCCSWFNYLF